MKRALMAGAAVAALAAFYGLQAEPSTEPKPMQTVVPGATCSTLGPLGVRGENVYECVAGHWQPLRLSERAAQAAAR